MNFLRARWQLWTSVNIIRCHLARVAINASGCPYPTLLACPNRPRTPAIPVLQLSCKEGLTAREQSESAYHYVLLLPSFCACPNTVGVTPSLLVLQDRASRRDNRDNPIAGSSNASMRCVHIETRFGTVVSCVRGNSAYARVVTEALICITKIDLKGFAYWHRSLATLAPKMTLSW